MHKHKEAQEGRVKLNIGGYRYETSVEALRRISHTFFDAYFSGRYAQDVCDDGSIFVDRIGEHFGHVLDYMRDGVVAVAGPSARPSVSLLRVLKREFGFYCIELMAEPSAESKKLEVAVAVGGIGADAGTVLSSMERYNAASGQWSVVASMSTARTAFGACMVAGELYVTGGQDYGYRCLASVEKYSPSSNAWSDVVPLPSARRGHSAVGVGLDMYVLGGCDEASMLDVRVLNFDTVANQWSTVAPLPEPRFSYMFGGCIQGGYVWQTSVLKYDTVANNWSTLPPMPYPSLNIGASLLGGLVYFVGMGGDGRAVLCFSPATGAWSQATHTRANYICGSSFVLGGCLYAAGGRGDTSSVEKYDVSSRTWTGVAPMLEGRALFYGITMVFEAPAKEEDLFDSPIAKAAHLTE
jgi:N-acetylneuraminic acid mutarotase